MTIYSNRRTYLNNLHEAACTRPMIAPALFDGIASKAVILHDNLAAIDRYLLHAREHPPSGFQLVEPTQLPPIPHEAARFVGRRAAFRSIRSAEITFVAYVCTHMGAPNTVAVVHGLRARDVTTVIKVGTASGLTSELQTGDVLVPSTAIADEGASKWNDFDYAIDRALSEYFRGRNTFPAHRPLCAALANRCPVLAGQKTFADDDTTIWSVDSYLTFIMCMDLYRKVEGENPIDGRHILGVEMECGGFFSTSTMLGLQAAALIVVSRSREEMEAPALGLPDVRNTEAVRTAERNCFEAATLEVLCRQ